jgi:RNA methyltransferase, TrmH family
VPRITSRQHPLVQRFRRLASHRDSGSVLLDGEHLIADALEARLPFQAMLTDGRSPRLADRARAAGAAVHEASAAVLEAASPVRTPTGVVAIASWSPVDLTAVFDAGSPILALLGVQDPGNVGSAIRSADALGARAVVVLEGTSHPAAWRTLRGAMGSTFRVPIACAPLADVLRESRARGVRVAATAAAGGDALGSTDLPRPLLLLLGGEGSGLSPEVLAGADRRVTIPMRGGVDSLNVAVTAALLLWEAGHPRRGARGTR